MSILNLSFLALVFCTVMGTAYVLMRVAAGGVVRGRIDGLSKDGAGGLQPPAHGTALIETVAKLTSPLGKLSLPKDDWERSAVRTRFITAGFRQPSAPAVFFAVKTMLALGLPLFAWLVLSARSTQLSTTAMLACLLLSATFGTYLPNLLLARAIAKRQLDISHSFPDALDLMTICVEAGLGIEAALARVASEMAMSSRILAEEMTLVTLELRAGLAKEKALRNLALRTGVEDVESLVAMLIQAERFGTSIGASLRVQSDLSRTKRRMRAEETAAKISLKLLFPLIFFIFPTLLLVLLGPAFIQIYRVLLPAMAAS
ncbi:MAG: type II secretion system F family protein [Telluria sp.]